MQNSIIYNKAFHFAVRIIELCRMINHINKNETSITQQLLKSGTAIGALVAEAGNAQSKADFINKMNVALKEANETNYWLNLFQATGMLPPSVEVSSYLNENIEIIKILVSIVKTSKGNLGNQK